MRLDSETLDTLCAHIAGIERLTPLHCSVSRGTLAGLHVQLRDSRGDVSDAQLDNVTDQLAIARRGLPGYLIDLAIGVNEIRQAIVRLRAEYRTAGVREKLEETARIGNRTLSRFGNGKVTS